jgi:membrane protein implicated in regulation of membrane protease activity
MEDRFVKYSKLYFLIFLLFLSIPVLLGIAIAIGYGFSKLVSSRPVDLLYQLLVIALPSSVFATVYYIFFRRTKAHPSAAVRMISRVVFVLGFCICLTILGSDFIKFFKNPVFGTEGYRNFSLLFLAGNVAALFIIAILQAFTTNKEEDWMEKRKRTGTDL